MTTKGGYDFYEVASLLQKSIRRNHLGLATRAANELFPDYANYTWNRLMTISAEDCAGIITMEIVALYDAWKKVNERSKDKSKGRVFIAKALIILARGQHSRDADELNNLTSDRFPEDVFAAEVATVTKHLGVESKDFQIPQYVYDKHTLRGKRAGKTVQDFLIEESQGLANPETVFANLQHMIEHRGFTEPDVRLEGAEWPWTDEQRKANSK